VVGGNRTLNKSVWSSVVFDAGTGDKPAVCLSVAEDVEGMPLKSDKIIESNLSPVHWVWVESAVTYADAEFGWIAVAAVAKADRESVAVGPAPISAAYDIHGKRSSGLCS